MFKQSLQLTWLIATNTRQDPDCSEVILISSKREDSSSARIVCSVYKKTKEWVNTKHDSHSRPRPRSYWSPPRTATSGTGKVLLSEYVQRIRILANQTCRLARLDLSIRGVTGSPWISDFRCWTFLEVVLTEISAVSTDENARSVASYADTLLARYAILKKIAWQATPYRISLILIVNYVFKN